MTLGERDVELIVERVRTRAEVTAIYLFGSHAKDSARPGSDIDLLIVGPSRLPRHHRGREVTAALATFPASFDLLFYTEQELTEECADPRSFTATVMRRSRILYKEAAHS